eukprot:jgi/Mesvir1/28744/Mv19712-RA.1
MPTRSKPIRAWEGSDDEEQAEGLRELESRLDTDGQEPVEDEPPEDKRSRRRLSTSSAISARSDAVSENVKRASRAPSPAPSRPATARPQPRADDSVPDVRAETARGKRPVSATVKRPDKQRTVAVTNLVFDAAGAQYKFLEPPQLSPMSAHARTAAPHGGGVAAAEARAKSARTGDSEAMARQMAFLKTELEAARQVQREVEAKSKKLEKENRALGLQLNHLESQPSPKGPPVGKRVGGPGHDRRPHTADPRGHGLGATVRGSPGQGATMTRGERSREGREELEGRGRVGDTASQASQPTTPTAGHSRQSITGSDDEPSPQGHRRRGGVTSSSTRTRLRQAAEEGRRMGLEDGRRGGGTVPDDVASLMAAMQEEMALMRVRAASQAEEVARMQALLQQSTAATAAATTAAATAAKQASELQARLLSRLMPVSEDAGAPWGGSAAGRGGRGGSNGSHTPSHSIHSNGREAPSGSFRVDSDESGGSSDEEVGVVVHRSGPRGGEPWEDGAVAGGSARLEPSNSQRRFVVDCEVNEIPSPHTAGVTDARSDSPAGNSLSSSGGRRGKTRPSSSLEPEGEAMVDARRSSQGTGAGDRASSSRSVRGSGALENVTRSRASDRGASATDTSRGLVGAEDASTMGAEGDGDDGEPLAVLMGRAMAELERVMVPAQRRVVAVLRDACRDNAVSERELADIREAMDQLTRGVLGALETARGCGMQELARARADGYVSPTEKRLLRDNLLLLRGRLDALVAQFREEVTVYTSRLAEAEGVARDADTDASAQHGSVPMAALVAALSSGREAVETRCLEIAAEVQRALDDPAADLGAALKVADESIGRAMDMACGAVVKAILAAKEDGAVDDSEQRTLQALVTWADLAVMAAIDHVKPAVVHAMFCVLTASGDSAGLAGQKEAVNGAAEAARAQLRDRMVAVQCEIAAALQRPPAMRPWEGNGLAPLLHRLKTVALGWENKVASIETEVARAVYGEAAAFDVFVRVQGQIIQQALATARMEVAERVHALARQSDKENRSPDVEAEAGGIASLLDTALTACVADVKEVVSRMASATTSERSKGKPLTPVQLQMIERTLVDATKGIVKVLRDIRDGTPAVLASITEYGFTPPAPAQRRLASVGQLAATRAQDAEDQMRRVAGQVTQMVERGLVFKATSPLPPTVDDARPFVLPPPPPEVARLVALLPAQPEGSSNHRRAETAQTRGGSDDAGARQSGTKGVGIWGDGPQGAGGHVGEGPGDDEGQHRRAERRSRDAGSARRAEKEEEEEEERGSSRRGAAESMNGMRDPQGDDRVARGGSRSGARGVSGSSRHGRQDGEEGHDRRRLGREQEASARGGEGGQGEAMEGGRRGRSLHRGDGVDGAHGEADVEEGPGMVRDRGGEGGREGGRRRGDADGDRRTGSIREKGRDGEGSGDVARERPRDRARDDSRERHKDGDENRDVEGGTDRGKDRDREGHRDREGGGDKEGKRDREGNREREGLRDRDGERAAEGRGSRRPVPRDRGERSRPEEQGGERMPAGNASQHGDGQSSPRDKGGGSDAREADAPTPAVPSSRGGSRRSSRGDDTAGGPSQPVAGQGELEAGHRGRPGHRHVEATLERLVAVLTNHHRATDLYRELDGDKDGSLAPDELSRLLTMLDAKADDVTMHRVKVGQHELGHPYSHFRERLAW